MAGKVTVGLIRGGTGFLAVGGPILERVWEMEVPVGVQGIAPGGGLEAKPPETEETLEIVHVCQLQRQCSY